MQIFAEINRRGDRINAHFPYEEELKNRVKAIVGARFVPPSKGGPLWEMPLDMTAGRALRRACKGHELVYGDALKAWGKVARAQEKEIGSLTKANNATLMHLPSNNPELDSFIGSNGRTYQRADTRFMAIADNPGNFNAPGGGKTVETIAAVYEDPSLLWGAHLVIAPLTSLDPVWMYELDRWAETHYILMCAFSDPARISIYNDALALYRQKKPFFLVTNPYAIQMEIEKVRIVDNLTGEYTTEERPKGIRAKQLARIRWNTVTVDEFHKCGLANKKSVTRKGADSLHTKKRMGISGTPFGGKVKKVFAVLSYLEPNIFTDEWKWIQRWMETKIEEVETGKGKTRNKVSVLGIKPGLEEEFYRAHARFFCRRTRQEMRPELKEVVPIPVWCEMTPTQAAQYRKFEKQAELEIEQHKLNAIGILAQYTRLRQFATSKVDLQTDRKGQVNVKHTIDSGKLKQLIRILGERGIIVDKDEEDGESSEQALIFSQWNEVLFMIGPELEKMGVDIAYFTGATGPRQRGELVRAFEARTGPRVMLMNTTAGGMSITLNQCESIHLIDETWDPDDTYEQAVGRNRENTADVYVYRSPETIEEYLQGVNITKGNLNKTMLDYHRKRLRELGIEALPEEALV